MNKRSNPLAILDEEAVREAFAVTQAQTYLKLLVDESLPARGVWEEDSARAMRVFQSRMGLEVTGALDGESFALLAEEGKRARRAAAPPPAMQTRRFFPQNGRYLPGESGEGIFLVQLMLLSAFRGEEWVEEVAVNGRYDAPTALALNRSRAVLGLAPDEVIDRVLWDALIALMV